MYSTNLEKSKFKIAPRFRSEPPSKDELMFVDEELMTVSPQTNTGNPILTMTDKHGKAGVVASIDFLSLVKRIKEEKPLSGGRPNSINIAEQTGFQSQFAWSRVGEKSEHMLCNLQFCFPHFRTSITNNLELAKVWRLALASLETDE